MNFKLSKLRKFKNIEGNYAFVNPPLKVEFESETVFDTHFDSPCACCVNLNNACASSRVKWLASTLTPDVSFLTSVVFK